jgi:hypothetical protein
MTGWQEGKTGAIRARRIDRDIDRKLLSGTTTRLAHWISPSTVDFFALVIVVNKPKHFYAVGGSRPNAPQSVSPKVCM